MSERASAATPVKTTGKSSNPFLKAAKAKTEVKFPSQNLSIDIRSEPDLVANANNTVNEESLPAQQNHSSIKADLFKESPISQDSKTLPSISSTISVVEGLHSLPILSTNSKDNEIVSVDTCRTEASTETMLSMKQPQVSNGGESAAETMFTNRTDVSTDSLKASRTSIKSQADSILLDIKMKERLDEQEAYEFDQYFNDTGDTDINIGDCEEDEESDEEVFMDEDESNYRSQRHAVANRRKKFTETLLSLYMGPWNSQPDVCQEIHSAVYHGQIDGLNTRRPGFIFARDSTGNTVMHTAILSVMATGGTNGASYRPDSVYSEVGHRLDRSEFGQTMLPEVTPSAINNMEVVLSILTQDHLASSSKKSDYSKLTKQPSKTTTEVKEPSEISQLAIVSFSSSSQPFPVLKTGWLLKRHDANSFKRRWVVLTNEEITYFESNEASLESWKGSLKLDGCTFYTQPTSPNTTRIADSSVNSMPSCSYTSFFIKATERKKRKKSVFSSLGSSLGYFGKGGCTIGDNDEKVTMQFVAESEQEAQQWVYILRAITDHIVPLPLLPTLKCVNIEARAVFVNVLNESGETPLHTIARHAVDAGEGDDYKFRVLTCVQWLFANECNPFIKNISGHTAAEVARECGNSEVAAWIEHFIPATIHGSTKSLGGIKQGFVPPPIRLPGYSYLSFVLHTQSYSNLARYFPYYVFTIKFIIDSGSVSSKEARFSDLGLLKLKVCVLTERFCSVNGKQVEYMQQSDNPLLRRHKKLFWGHTFHLQVPLENMPEVACVEFYLVGSSLTTDSLSAKSPNARSSGSTPESKNVLTTKCLLPLNVAKMTSGPITLDFKEAPLTLVEGRVREAPPSRACESMRHTILSMSAFVTRISL